MLQTLDFSLGNPLPTQFLQRYSKGVEACESTVNIASYAMELSQASYNMVRHPCCCSSLPRLPLSWVIGSLHGGGGRLAPLDYTNACERHITCCCSCQGGLLTQKSLAMPPFASQIKYKPSILAASSIVLAREVVGVMTWSESLQFYSGYTADQLEGCIEVCYLLTTTALLYQHCKGLALQCTFGRTPSHVCVCVCRSPLPPRTLSRPFSRCQRTRTTCRSRRREYLCASTARLHANAQDVRLSHLSRFVMCDVQGLKDVLKKSAASEAPFRAIHKKHSKAKFMATSQRRDLQQFIASL